MTRSIDIGVAMAMNEKISYRFIDCMSEAVCTSTTSHAILDHGQLLAN